MPTGERLDLWDTPGFGDSVRLARRLSAHVDPIAWFVSHVWDRFRDRPLWLAQKAVRGVRERADVVLYLVNAAEAPDDAGYLAPELAVLAWVGKPVVVLLNQTGPPRPHDVEVADEARWSAALAGHPQVRGVLTLDAFARCWVQELTLFSAVVRDALPASQRQVMQRLRVAWRERSNATFLAALRSLAQSIARTALATEALPQGGDLRARIRDAGAALGIGKADGTPAARAQRALAARLDAEARANTLELIGLHGLGGSAERDILERIATGFEMRLRLDENSGGCGRRGHRCAVGLKADVLSGGLTLGGGLLTGGILGARRPRAPNLVRVDRCESSPGRRRPSMPSSRQRSCVISRSPTSAAAGATGRRTKRRCAGRRWSSRHSCPVGSRSPPPGPSGHSAATTTRRALGWR